MQKEMSDIRKKFDLKKVVLNIQKLNWKSGMSCFLPICFLLFIIFDVSLIGIQWKNYNEKMELLYAVVSETDTTKKVTEILKGEEIETRKGEQFLRRYGYEEEKGNALYRKFLGQCGTIIGLSFGCFGIGVGTFLFLCWKERKKEENEIQQLAYILSSYRREEFPKIIVKESQFLKSDKKNISIDSKQKSDTMVYGISNKKWEIIYLELEELGNTIQLLHERMKKEREETKSLVTDISHQLKTPIAALKASFEILQQENLTKEEKQEFTERCNLQIDGIENLLSALVNISRMESGMIAIQQERACFFDTILHAVNRIYEKAAEKNIAVELEAGEELEQLNIWHDPKWIGEALINVLENAVKYSPNNTTITIRMIKRTTFLRLEIEDQGIGIPKQDYNKVFQRFFRGNLESVKRECGSGVGLYLTREILNRHHGTIRAEAGSGGNGTKFVIQLPYR